MKITEIQNELKKSGEKEKIITVDTEYEGLDYTGRNIVTYPASATLTIEHDRYYISAYDFFVNGEWLNTEERNWDKPSIEQTFDVIIDV